MNIEGKKAYIIDDEGNISCIEDQGYSVGEELEIEVKTQTIPDRILMFAKRNMPVIAAAAAFVVMLSGGVSYVNLHAYSTVTLDINPSLKYSLNLFDKVIEVDSFNNDGEEIVTQIEKGAKGKTLDNVVSLTLDELDRTGYVGEDTSVVVTLGSRAGNEDRLEDEVLESVSKWNETKTSEGESKSVSVETVKVTPQMADMAEEKGVSPGKIYIVGKLKEQVLENAEFDEDEWLTKSVKEIREAEKSVSDQTPKTPSVSADKSVSSQAKAPANSSAGSTGSEASAKAVSSEKPVNNGKKNSKKKKTSGSEALSADKAGETVSEGSAGGAAAVSGNEVPVPVPVSGNTVPEEPTPLIQPTVSSQPVSEPPADPVQTETGTAETADMTFVDQSGTDSSYLDVPVTQDAKCDSILSEDE